MLIRCGCAKDGFGLLGWIASGLFGPRGCAPLVSARPPNIVLSSSHRIASHRRADRERSAYGFHCIVDNKRQFIDFQNRFDLGEEPVQGAEVYVSKSVLDAMLGLPVSYRLTKTDTANKLA